MDARSDLSSLPQHDTLDALLPEEEQQFSEWVRKRLSLHQMMDQQIQTSVKQIIHFGSEFTRQLEEESERLLLRYRRQRLDQLQLRDTLRQEVSELRATLAEERRVHEADLAQARREAEIEIAQARREVEVEIAQQRATAQAERERVLSETRQLSARLTELQRSLSDMLRLAPVPDPLYSGGIQPRSTAAPLPASALTYAPGPPINDGPSEAIIAPGEDELGSGDFVDQSAFVADWGAARIEALDPPEAAPAYEYLVLFKNVQSFVVASDLLEQLGQIAEIREARLVEYELQELTIALTYAGTLPINDLLTSRLGSIISLAAEQGGQVHLTYNAVG
jgi:hypothetical protein